jgi:hypothetical protein
VCVVGWIGAAILCAYGLVCGVALAFGTSAEVGACGVDVAGLAADVGFGLGASLGGIGEHGVSSGGLGNSGGVAIGAGSRGSGRSCAGFRGRSRLPFRVWGTFPVFRPRRSLLVTDCGPFQR